MGYHFVRALEAHYIDSVACDADEEEPHRVEVETTPVVFEDHVGVTGGEDN